MDYEAIEAMVDAPFQKVTPVLCRGARSCPNTIQCNAMLVFITLTNLVRRIRRANLAPAQWTWMSLAETLRGTLQVA